MALNFAKAGEIRLGGYGGRIIDYSIENQLLDEELWRLFVNEYRIRTDTTDGGWRGEFWGKMMRGAALTYRATKNEKLYSVMVNTINDLLTTQEGSGRISTYEAEKEFFGWDMWARKYIMLGLIYFLDVCKSKALRARIIRALKRHADYILKKVGVGRGKLDIYETSAIWGTMNSASILEPMVKLHLLTGERRYLDFATYIVNSGMSKDYDLVELALNDMLYPYQYPYTKAYEMMSCFEGLLEYYKIMGNPEHLRAIEGFVAKVVESDYTIIGCSGCEHELFDNSTVKQTEPAQFDVMQETCVTVTFIKLCAKLLSVTGNAKYAEYIEKSGLNALYGAVNNEKQKMLRTVGRIYYWEDKNTPLCNPLPFDSYSPLYMDRRAKRTGGFQTIGEGRGYGCCACIASCGTALMSLYSIMTGEDGIYINMYADNRFKTTLFGKEVSVTVYADPYKANGAKIKVYGNGEKFALALRAPSYAEGFTVELNGERVEGEIVNGYFVFNHAFTKDTVTVSFKAGVKMSLINKKIAFTKGPVTLSRDCRFDDITRPVSIGVKNGKAVRARGIKNTRFSSNIAYEITTRDGVITLCDYAQAGKNYDDENATITVWQEYID